MSIENLNHTNVFVFSGHGTQHNKMCKELYENHQFKNIIDEIDDIFIKYFNYSVMNKVWSLDENNENDMKLLSEPLLGQCSLLIVQVSLFKYLKQYLNIEPKLIIGHSFSEFFVLHLCGLISLEDACYLTYNITKIQQKTNGSGKMLSINISKDDFNLNYLNNEDFKSFEILCYNSENSIVVGGYENNINLLSNKLKDDNIFNVILNSSTVFHSSAQDEIKNEILNLKTSNIILNKSNLNYPMISTVTGELLDFNDNTFNLNEYLYDNIRNAVQFTKSINSIYNYIIENNLNSNINFIEISPNPALIYYLKQNKPSDNINDNFKSIKYISTLKKSMKNQFEQINKIKELLINDENEVSNNIVLNYNINKYNQIKLNNNNEENEIFDKLLIKISNLLNIKDFKLLNLEISLIDWGMSSLLIVQLKNFIEKEYSCLNLFTINLLQQSNIIEIFNLIKINKNTNLKINYTNEFWNNEIKLDESITPHINQLKSFEKGTDLNVLLTGATGFIGAYILAGLIKISNVKKVYCLVRKKTSNTNPIESLITNMKNHKLYSSLTSDQLNKIKPIIGDMSKNKFDMNEIIYNKLSNKINIILNSGANVSFSSEYFDNKEVNVFGLLELLKFSVNGNQLKRVIHLSTMTVFVNDSNISESFDENYFPDINQINNLNGYMQTKVVAEYLLNEAANRGIPCQLIRPPFVFSNPSTGIGNTNDYLQLIIQCCYALKAIPLELDDCHFFQVSITWLADSILNLMNGDENSSWLENKLNIFNLTGDTKPLTYFFNILKSQFNDIKEVSYENWIEMISKSDNISCIRISTFHSLDLNKFKINKYLNISSNTIKILEYINKNNNNQYNNTLNQYNVTNEMIFNHINYIFNYNKN